ncbi:MAG: transglutaminase family protein [Capsulimonadales bacterium]|nr:transglutaminase family protein [Capsulimonadales bacterium]
MAANEQDMAISVFPISDAAARGPLPDVIPLPEEFPPAVAMNRTTLRVVQMTDYEYDVPARNITTYLKLIPPTHRGWQTRLDFGLRTAPLPHASLTLTDELGNQYEEVRHERVRTHLTFAVEATVRTHCAYTVEGISLPIPVTVRPGEASAVYRGVTERTTPNKEMTDLAETICLEIRERRSTLRLFAALCDRVHREMHFDSGATGVRTVASEAWQQRRGVCQDYSHITLALCRLCGMTARYVSGFVPGEGVMHAWTEALVPIRVGNRNREFWFAYDPTYNKWVDDNYVTVAVGRDFGDITPTSGTYFGGASTVRYRNKVTVTGKKIHLL